MDAMIDSTKALSDMSLYEYQMREKMLAGLTIDEINDIFGITRVFYWGSSIEYRRGRGECLIISLFHKPEVYYA